MNLKTILQIINAKNFIKCVDAFSKVMQAVVSGIEELTKELDNSEIIESSKENQAQKRTKEYKPSKVKFWSDISDESQISQDRINLEKFWGESKVKIWSDSMPDSEFKDKIDLEKFWGKRDD